MEVSEPTADLQKESMKEPAEEEDGERVGEAADSAHTMRNVGSVSCSMSCLARSLSQARGRCHPERSYGVFLGALANQLEGSPYIDLLLYPDRNFSYSVEGQYLISGSIVSIVLLHCFMLLKSSWWQHDPSLP